MFEFRSLYTGAQVVDCMVQWGEHLGYSAQVLQQARMCTVVASALAALPGATQSIHRAYQSLDVEDSVFALAWVSHIVAEMGSIGFLPTGSYQRVWKLASVIFSVMEFSVMKLRVCNPPAEQLPLHVTALNMSVLVLNFFISGSLALSYIRGRPVVSALTLLQLKTAVLALGMLQGYCSTSKKPELDKKKELPEKPPKPEELKVENSKMKPVEAQVSLEAVIADPLQTNNVIIPVGGVPTAIAFVMNENYVSETKTTI